MRKGKNSVPRQKREPGAAPYQQKRLKSRAVNQLVTLYERDDCYYCTLCKEFAVPFDTRRAVIEHLIDCHPVELATKMAELRGKDNRQEEDE